MNNLMDLSISLVTYKPDLNVLAKTLSTLHASLLDGAITSKLFIVDNSCDKQWQAKIMTCMTENFPNINGITSEFVVSPGNIGYGRANNIAIDLAHSKYHLVINPDVFVYNNTISQAISYMDQNPDTGLLTPSVYGEDGERHYLCKTNPTLFIMFLRSFAPRFINQKFTQSLVKFEMRDKNYDEIILNIPYPTGCFMFFRTSLLKKLHGFTPDFFMYLEDADIGRRMLAIAKSAYVPAVKIIHKWARGSHTSFKLKWVTIQSAVIYWRKWGGIFKSS